MVKAGVEYVSERHFLVGLLLILQVVPVQAKPATEETLPLNYIALDTMMAPVVDEYRLLGTLEVKLVLKVDDRDERSKLAHSKPRLVDTFNQALAEFSRLRVDPGRPVDVSRLASHLQAATDRLAPARKAQVLVLEAVVRRT